MAAPPSEALKWLRFYLDFCMKYRQPPRDRESLQPFLNKLTEKRQSLEQQQQASLAIGVFYELMATWPTSPHADQPREAARAPWDACCRRLKEEIRLRQYSDKTLQAYTGWVRRFSSFLEDKPPDRVDSEDARCFLTHLAVDGRVAASTQNQAFNALLFLYRHVLKQDYDLKDKVVRARRSKYIPVVLSRREVDAVVTRLRPPYKLTVQLLYGCGLRLAECLNLRTQCLNFDHGIITVHDGKGGKDRTVPLPQSLVAPLKEQLETVRRLHEEDLAAGYAGVFLPKALDRKLKSQARESIWQWVFPARTLTLVPDTGERRRYHMHESELSKALRGAVKRSGVEKRVTCHTFRHSFASHLLRANYDIRTIQQLLGHSDIKTTMIYTHTVRSRTAKEVESPLDFGPDKLKMVNDFGAKDEPQPGDSPHANGND